MSDGDWLGWPKQEPIWLDFEMGAGMIAGKDFLSEWHGVDSAPYAQTMSRAMGEWWSQITAGKATSWVIGDVPGLLAPSVGVRNQLPILCLWKWLGAPENFVLPVKYSLGSVGESRSEWSGTVSTLDEEMYLFGSHQRGGDVLRDPGKPTLSFKRGTCNIDVRTIAIGDGLNKAEFQVFILWGSYVGLRWEPSP